MGSTAPPTVPINIIMGTVGSLLSVRSAVHTVYLCVLCGSENKRRLFPYTALTEMKLQNFY